MTEDVTSNGEQKHKIYMPRQMFHVHS